MDHQTLAILDHQTGQGKKWWRTLLSQGAVILRSLLCMEVTEESMSPLMDLVGFHSSAPSSSPPLSIYEGAVSFDNDITESIISVDDVEEALSYNSEEDRQKRVAKGKFQLVSDGSTTDSSEYDGYSSDEDELLKQITLEKIWYDRQLEDWDEFKTPGAIYHMGETSGSRDCFSTSSSSEFGLAELEFLEMIHF